MTVADIIRHKADGLQAKIDHARNGRGPIERRDGEALSTIQAVMRELANHHEAGTCPKAIRDWRDVTVISNAVRVVRTAERMGEDCLKRLTEEQRAIQALMPKPFERYPGEVYEKPGKVYGNGHHVAWQKPVEEFKYTAAEEAFFRAADTARTPAEHERAHRLGVKAFPRLAKQYKDQIAEATQLDAVADPEYTSRMDAARVTAEFKTRSRRRLDSGRLPITDAEMFGGPAQGSLF